MMCYGQERDTGFWIKRAVFIPLAIAAGIFIFGGAVMLLWNWLLPAIFGFDTITFWQALGIMVLSKILFSGFRGGHSHSKYPKDGYYWREKWRHLTPEEREKMKAEWKSRCMPPVKEE